MVDTKNFKKFWHGLNFQIHGRPRFPIPVVFCDNFAGSQDQIEEQATAVINAFGGKFEVIYFNNDPKTAELEIKHIFDPLHYSSQHGNGIAMGTRNYERKAKAIVIGTGIGLQEQATLRRNVVNDLPNGVVNVPWLVPELKAGAIDGPGHGDGYPLQLLRRVKHRLQYLCRGYWKHSGNNWYRY